MNTIACSHCDLLLSSLPIESGQSAVCPRCGQTVYTNGLTLSTSIALLITALIVYVPAILMPFLSIETGGRVNSMNLINSVATIAHGKTLTLAIVILFLVLILPLVKLLGLLAIALPLSKGKANLLTRIGARYLINLLPWSMLEVYLIGVLITLVKLTSYANVTLLMGFYAFFILIILNAFISMRLSKQQLWQFIHTIHFNDDNVQYKRH